MKQLLLTSSAAVSINHWIKELPAKPSELSLAFIATAAEVERGDTSWLAADRQALVDVGFSVTDYTLTGKKTNDLERDLAPIDVLFVAGGNTFFLLEQARQSGFLNLLRQVSNQKLYVGSSAGSILLCPDIAPLAGIDDQSVVPSGASTVAAGLVPFLVLPHWSSPVFAPLYTQALPQFQKAPWPLVTLTDEHFLVVRNQTVRFHPVV